MATILDLSRSDLSQLAVPETSSITDLEHLSSYNWSKSSPLTIAVPGCPPLWSPSPGPLQISKDVGKFYVAENAARHPEFPMESMFQALYAMRPQYEVDSIDVVTDRNCLRKLLGFVASRFEKKESFTICVETVKNTILLCRKEKKSRWIQYIRHDQFFGYGHTFEKKFTTRHREDLSAHQRIITYRFGGLKFLVAHETDAYVSENTAAANQGPEIPLSGLSLTPQSSAETKPPGSKMTICAVGETIDTADTIEIKTKSHTKKGDLQFPKVAAQLYFGQTPKLVRAFHADGRFEVPEVENVSTQIEKWEKYNQDSLALLAALILKIKDVERPHERVVINFDHKTGKLTIKENDGRFPKTLPAALYAHWNVTPDFKVPDNSADALNA